LKEDKIPVGILSSFSEIVNSNSVSDTNRSTHTSLSTSDLLESIEILYRYIVSRKPRKIKRKREKTKATMKLKKIKSIELVPLAPFRFDPTFHKPDHFESGDNFWQPNIRWQTCFWQGKQLGLKFTNKGTINQPRIRFGGVLKMIRF